MAHLEPNGPGWRVVWREGRRRRKSPTYDTKALATAAQRTIEAERARTAPAIPGAIIPWAQLVERFVVSRADTTDRHRVKVRRTLDALGAARGWHASSSVSPSTCEGLAHYHGRVLRALLRYAKGLNQPVDERVLDMSQPRQRQQPAELLTRTQLRKLLGEAARWHPVNATIAHLIATYGHRAESLVGLTAAAVAAGKLFLRVKSGDRIGHLLLPADARRLAKLAKGLAPDAPLFVGHMGRPFASGDEFSAWWGHQVGKVAPFPSGRKPGILDLRRFAITTLLSRGVDAKTAASITGHRTPVLLQNVYARTSEAMQRRALRALA